MDDADFASETAERLLQSQIDAARADLPPGMPGDCDTCGSYSGRLVDGRCVQCRSLDEERARIHGMRR